MLPFIFEAIKFGCHSRLVLFTFLQSGQKYGPDLSNTSAPQVVCGAGSSKHMALSVACIDVNLSFRLTEIDTNYI